MPLEVLMLSVVDENGNGLVTYLSPPSAQFPSFPSLLCGDGMTEGDGKTEKAETTKTPWRR